MAAPILLGAFAFSVPTKVVAQETEPTEEVASEPEEEKEVVVEEEKTEEAIVEETKADEQEVVLEETISTPEADTPADEAQVTDTESDTTEAPKEEEARICLGDGDSISESSKDDWNWNEDEKKAETKENVRLGVKYVFPGRDNVEVTFTCLPNDASKLDTLKIREINSEDINLPSGIGAASPYAYDVTVGMDNGDFKYDIVLPKAGDVNANLSYIEKSADEIKGKDIERNDLKEVSDKDSSDKGDTIEATNLDHFTIFVATFASDFSTSKITYTQGETVYLKATGLTSGNHYRLAIDPPGNNNFTYLPGCTTGVTELTGTYALASNATVSNQWKAEVHGFSSLSSCNNAASDHNPSDDSTFTVTEAKPELTIVKSHTPAGNVSISQAFSWKLHVENVGNASAVFSNGEDVLRDNLPSSGAVYGTPTVSNQSGITGTISCAITSNNLICESLNPGSVTIGALGSFDVTWDTTPTVDVAGGTLKNPRTGQGMICKVDPDSKESESNENNNTCSETISINDIQHIPVTLCHATPPDTAANGYNSITTDDDGALSGHNSQHSADIIPPFNYYGGSFAGKNWTAEGEAIWKNECVAKGGLKAIKIVDDQSLLSQWSFQLDNGAPIQANSNGEVDFGQVSLGQHMVTESGPNGYNLSQVANCTQVENTLSAMATVIAGVTTVCTFSNAVSKGSITVIKDAQPDSTQDFSFMITGHDQGVFTLDDDGNNQNELSNTKNFQNLFPGQYSISEEEVGSWDLETLSCGNGEASLGLKEGNTISFTLHPGENITCTFTNVQKPGILHVKKIIENGNLGTQQFQDFAFQINSGEPTTFDSVDGQNDIEVPANGTYTVTEVLAPGYETSYENCTNLTIPALGEETCTITNRINPVHVVATKIVCTDEADLPNYGEGGPDITASTAADWIASHKSCSLAPDWQFQWSYDGTPHQGDNVDFGGAGWTTSDFTNGSGQVTMDIPNSEDSPKLWFREVYKDSFIPFTFNLPGGENNANPVSAEIYCHNDVVNYDNWDWVGNPENGGTYYCVAWNVAKAGKIIGYKFSDTDGDGVEDEGETGLAGWTLYLDLNNNGTLDEGEPSGVTGEDGTYTFENLTPGNYVVREVFQEGWEQTLDTCGPQIIDEGEDEFPTEQLQLVSRELPGIYLKPSGEVNCTFGNHSTEQLRLTKSVDVTDVQEPGNFVVYTLTVEAEEGTVLDTEVTDLPPKGFEYVAGSAEATSSLGGSHDGPLELSHEYASPGVWSVGNLVPGETVTLKYQAKISSAQDDGLYEDLAYARGSAQGGGDVLANDPTGFVGTQVAVATPVVDPIANVDTDNKKDVDTDTKRKTLVLGASTGLPATGANGGILLLALALLIAGAGMMLWSRRTSAKMLFLSLAFTGACLMGGGQVLAAGPGLALEIEKPDTMVTNPNFKIGFVALDTEGRPVTYKCYETSYGSFQQDTLINGGSSGDCQVSATVMPADGNYSFYVTAEVADEAPISSETVNVTFDGTFPGTPYNYDRDEATCDDKITFTTANDGQTVKVELYRSTEKDFVADTPITTLDIGPNQNGYISTTPPDCNEDYWYALRALDANGNASGFVADRAVNTDTIHKTKTKTTTVGQAGNGGGGAIPVASGGTGEGEGGTVEGAATEAAGAEGVLGEMTEDKAQDQSALSSWAQNNKGSLFFILLIIGGLLYYFFYVRPKTALTKN